MLSPRSRLSFRPGFGFAALSIFLITLWLAGGGSRGDVAGQIVVRTVALLVLIALILFGQPKFPKSSRPVWIFLFLVVAITIAQLLPLPVPLWKSLKGYEMIGDVAEAGTWRRWSLVPGATLNALVSLVVPFTVIALTATLNKQEQAAIPGVILTLSVLSMLLGLFQLSGLTFNNPMINDQLGKVSGTFANRNHFSTFMALGCLVIPAWVFRNKTGIGWRGIVGFGLLLLFMLTIIASGSRAGMAVGAMAIVIVVLLSWHGMRQKLRHASFWVVPSVIAAAVLMLISLLFISIAAGRAVSVQRILSDDVKQDMRSRAFPTVWDMIGDTFPVGSGLGGFDTMFRMNEPLNLLNHTYFNQAHNDFLGVVLDTGLAGLLLVAAALAWWVWASVRAWRGRRDRVLPRLGSAMILLVVVSSVFDYPARTPLIVAMLAIAATWLSGYSDEEIESALPRSGQQL